jgi:hypothetical protein
MNDQVGTLEGDYRIEVRGLTKPFGFKKAEIVGEADC